MFSNVLDECLEALISKVIELNGDVVLLAAEHGRVIEFELFSGFDACSLQGNVTLWLESVTEGEHA